MPGNICSVAICKNASVKSKKLGESLRFFLFPKDPKIREAWVKKCHRKDKWNPSTSHICGKHFKEEDFEDAMQARLMNFTPRKLKKTAIPSLYLLPSPKDAPNEVGQPRAERMLAKQRREMVKNLLKTPPKASPSSPKKSPTLPRKSPSSPASPSKRHPIFSVQEIPSESTPADEIERLKSKISSLEESLKEWEKKFQVVDKEKADLKEKVKKLENHIEEMKEKIDAKIDSQEALKNNLSHALTPNQIDILLKRKTRARWTTEELSRAFTLRYFSKRSYIYLKQSLNYPLPGISTLQRWASTIKLRNGILEDVLRVMKVVGSTKSNLHRTTILSFDEMKVSSVYEYHQKEDEVVGRHSYMQVVMARGLFEQWKQPVFIAFDQKVDRALLTMIISKLSEINYNVVACVCDCGGGNMGLWRELNITVENVFIPHPSTQKPLYFFADAPHILKLLRNWFLDTGFTLQDGTCISKGPVEALLQSADAEISAVHKLSQRHIDCVKTQRQNVSLAAQLFSHTTATALKKYLPGSDKALAKNVADFIELVGYWYDIMNSYTHNTNIPSKKPYGLDLSTQDEVLEKMKLTVSGMVCTGKKTLQLFQKGLLISIKSLQLLFTTLKEEFNISFILTHRLNQDCLENFFSQIRTRGGLHDHPSPLNALYRVRMILLGKTPGMVQAGTNVVNLEEGNETYVFAAALKHANISSEVAKPIPLVEELPDDASIGSSSGSTSSLEGNPVEEDGLQYIAGFLAKKHRKDFPSLGVPTSKTDEPEHPYSIPGWLQSLSYGGLMQPSVQWDSQVKQMEKYFKKFHKSSFSTKLKIVKATFDYIKMKCPDVPDTLIQSYCRLRIFIRIKYLNITADSPGPKRKEVSPSDKNKIVKKLKKFQ